MSIIRNQKGVTLQFSKIGATWLSCKLPLSENQVREVILTCQSPENNSLAFIGSTIGRYANRIKNAIIEKDNQVYNLNANQGVHQLHGGIDGFYNRIWKTISHQPNRIIFGLISEDGDQGFPGEIKVTVDYLLTDSNQVMINYIATTDQTTPINLTNHAYFNLDGEGDILGHQLYVNADYYLAVDSEGIPISQLTPVEQGNMDLRHLDTIGQTLLSSADRQQLQGYDHAYLLNHENQKLEKPIARLISNDKKVEMKVFTDKPAIQIYTGNHLGGVAGDKGFFENYQGIALETEFLPDSPNCKHRGHETCWFTSKQFYCYTTIYQFYF